MESDFFGPLLYMVTAENPKTLLYTYSMYYETRTTPENWHWIFSAGHRKCFFHYLAKFCIFFLVFVSYRMNAEGTRRK